MQEKLEKELNAISKIFWQEFVNISLHTHTCKNRAEIEKKKKKIIHMKESTYHTRRQIFESDW